MPIIEIRDRTSHDTLLVKSPYTVMFFGAKTCGHCIGITPYINQLSESEQLRNVAFGHIEMTEVECDNVKSEGFGVPCFVMYQKEKPREIIIGANRDKIQVAINRLLGR